jgi:uracil-DNA glycosylase
MKSNDVPRLFRHPEAIEARMAGIELPHIAPLTAYVHHLRERLGDAYDIPYFDPWDRGVYADVLFLLEAPGPMASSSGFVSRNNNDQTAANIWELTRRAGIERKRCVNWNVVPWFCHHDGGLNRNPKSSEIEASLTPLADLLNLLPDVLTVVLMGKAAQSVQGRLEQLRAELNILKLPHPSPQNLNTRPHYRELIVEALTEVA